MYKTDLTIYDSSSYNPGSIFKRSLWYIINFLFFLNPLNPNSSIKIFLLRLFGSKVGKGVIIKPRVNIKYPWFLSIDDYTWIGERVWLDNLDMLTIGKNVCISQGSVIISGNHNYKKINFELKISPIKLEDGVWIGACSVVTSGVICKSHSVLSVNSVASQNLEPYTIYRGNPAQAVKKRIVEI